MALVGFSALASVERALRVTDNDALTSVKCPILATVGRQLAVDHNDALTGVEIPALSEVGGYLGVRHNDALSSFEFPSLTSLNGVLGQGDDLSALIVLGNERLARFDLSSLHTVTGDLLVSQNELLAQCEVDHFAAQLEELEWIGDWFGESNCTECRCD